jgi:hypothetical protein
LFVALSPIEVHYSLPGNIPTGGFPNGGAVPALCNRLCPMVDLAPLPLAGLFHAGPPRSAQPTERLGVGVLGLRFGEIVQARYGNKHDPPSPATWRGSFCEVSCALCNQPPAAPVDGAGLLAAFAKMSNRVDMAQTAGKPTIPQTAVGTGAVRFTGRRSGEFLHQKPPPLLII